MESHFHDARMTPIRDAVKNPYDNQNLPLRPYLGREGGFMNNVEDNVQTLKNQDINYLLVLEDRTHLHHNVGLMCAPNKVP
jgi:hypothetical protein